jgi:hypothetical protein
MMSIDNTVTARTIRFPFPCASVPSVDNMHFFLLNAVRYSWSVASIKSSQAMNIVTGPDLKTPKPKDTEASLDLRGGNRPPIFCLSWRPCREHE